MVPKWPNVVDAKRGRVKKTRYHDHFGCISQIGCSLKAFLLSRVRSALVGAVVGIVASGGGDGEE